MNVEVPSTDKSLSKMLNAERLGVAIQIIFLVIIGYFYPDYKATVKSISEANARVAAQMTAIDIRLTKIEANRFTATDWLEKAGLFSKELAGLRETLTDLQSKSTTNIPREWFERVLKEFERRLTRLEEALDKLQERQRLNPAEGA